MPQILNVNEDEVKPRTLSGEVDLASWVFALIIGRFGLILVLLLANLWWANTFLDLSVDSFPDSLYWLFFLGIGLNAVYLLCSRYFASLLWQIRIQLLVDAFLITWLVAATGNLISPYITLYVVLISIAGYFLGKKETIIFSILSAACFSFVSILSSQSVIYSLSGQVRPSRYVQIIAFNTIGILIVGLLAGRLSEWRKVGKRLKEAEESFEDLQSLHQRIVESIRSGLITTDLSGKIRTFNRAAEEISGCKGSDIIGGSIYTMFGDNIRAAVDLCLYRAAESQEFPTEHFEATVSDERNNNGSEENSTVACSVAPLIGKTGMVTGLILSFQDLTEIRAMEESLRRSDRLAAVGRMAAGLAHEIRNPLGSMGSALQFLEENVEPATPEANLMDVVLRESERLNNIIKNFLVYARLSASDTATKDFESTDVVKAIEDCMTLLRHSPDVEKGHVLDSDLPEGPVNIISNENQIKQVFWNLMQNSIQAMPEGGRLGVKLEDFPGSNVRIIFDDTGSGISAENFEHLYEPFAAGAGGAGLGLSIVHKIVSDHGGNIDIENRTAGGTTVTLELPH